jgi:hypothetical protein
MRWKALEKTILTMCISGVGAEIRGSQLHGRSHGAWGARMVRLQGVSVGSPKYSFQNLEFGADPLSEERVAAVLVSKYFPLRRSNRVWLHAVAATAMSRSSHNLEIDRATTAQQPGCER